MSVPRRLAVLVAAAAPLTWVCGCSWMSMGPVPERPAAGGTVECTASKSAPAADVFGAVFFGAPGGALLVGGAVAASRPGCPPEPAWCIVDGRKLGYAMIGLGAIGLGIATLYSLSAWHGLRHAARCEELRRASLDGEGVR